MTTLKLPFAPEAKKCHDDLPKTSAVYRDGFARLVKTVEGSGAFGERFGKVVKAHEATIAAGQAAPSSGPLMESDIYLCCFYDLLEGWLSKEAEAVKASAATPEAKKKALDALWAPIDALNWSGPKWTSIQKPRLKQRLE